MVCIDNKKKGVSNMQCILDADKVYIHTYDELTNRHDRLNSAKSIIYNKHKQ